MVSTCKHPVLIIQLNTVTDPGFCQGVGPTLPTTVQKSTRCQDIRKRYDIVQGQGDPDP